MKKLAILTALALGLAACSFGGSIEQEEPVGIGTDRNALKKSPCACIEIDQDYSAWTKESAS